MFLKNKNIIFKIRRSKVTDYAALTIFESKFLKKIRVLGCLFVNVEEKRKVQLSKKYSFASYITAVINSLKPI